MQPELYALLLLAALACYYVRQVATAEPVYSICHGCGDIVQHLPGWPCRCPNCGRLTLI